MYTFPMIPTIVTRSILVESGLNFFGRVTPCGSILKKWMSTKEEEEIVPKADPSTRDGKKGKSSTQKLDMMPIPKPIYGKKALMNLRKKTGFSVSECRKALLKHDLNFEAALNFLKYEAVKEEDDQLLVREEEEDPVLPEGPLVSPQEASGTEEMAKKKKKKKMKGGVVFARLSKDAAMLLEMNCQSVTLTRNEEFHDLVNCVADVVFDNAQSLVKGKAGAIEDIRINDVDGSIVKSSLSTNDILSLKKISSSSANATEGGKSGTEKLTTVKRLVAEGKAKLGEALSPKRCVIYAASGPDSAVSGNYDDSGSLDSATSGSHSDHVVSSSPRLRFHFGFYVHPSSVRGSITQRPLNGRYGALVALAKISDAINEKHFDFTDIGRKLAQHVVGMNPKSIGEYRVDRGKSTDSKTDGNHLSEFGLETRLLEQEFLLDSTFLVKEYLFINGVRVVDFVRFECAGK